MTEHKYNLNRVNREDRNKHKGMVIWLTGLSAAGKSTVANALEQRLFQKNIQCYALDGDNIRRGLCSDLGFSHEDRTENIRRIGEVAKLFMDAGFISIAAFISPYRSDRDTVREIVEAGRFVEVFVDCSLEECEKRDPKSLYKKARSGEITDFTGVSAPYEPPEHPEVHLNTQEQSIEQCVDAILDYLQNKM